MESFYALMNNTSPFRYRNFGSDLQQTAEHVAPEVLVGWVISKMFGKKDTPGLVDMTLVHTLSIPLIGGLGYLIAPSVHPDIEAAYSAQLQAGVAGVPAVFVAQYILRIFEGAKFMHWKFNLRNFLIMATSKIITRPLVSAVGTKVMSKEMAAEYAKLQVRFDNQSKNAFNYLGKGAAAGAKKVN